MGAVLFVVIAVVAISVLAGSHLYMWRRFVRDVSRPGSRWRRLGTVLAVLLPVTTFANLILSRSEAPFALKQALAWPGFLWLACVLYLTLALLAGELIRFVTRRTAWGRERAAATSKTASEAASEAGPEPGTGTGAGPETEAGSEIEAAAEAALASSIPAA